MMSYIYRHADGSTLPHTAYDVLGAGKGLTQQGKGLLFDWCIERFGNSALRKPTKTRNPGRSAVEEFVGVGVSTQDPRL